MSQLCINLSVDSLSLSLPIYTAPLDWKCGNRTKEGLPAPKQIQNDHFCPGAGCSGLQQGTSCRIHPDREIWGKGPPKKTAGCCQSACHNRSVILPF